MIRGPGNQVPPLVQFLSHQDAMEEEENKCIALDFNIF